MHSFQVNDTQRCQIIFRVICIFLKNKSEFYLYHVKIKAAEEQQWGAGETGQQSEQGQFLEHLKASNIENDAVCLLFFVCFI